MRFIEVCSYHTVFPGSFPSRFLRGGTFPRSSLVDDPLRVRTRQSLLCNQKTTRGTHHCQLFIFVSTTVIQLSRIDKCLIIQDRCTVACGLIGWYWKRFQVWYPETTVVNYRSNFRVQSMASISASRTRYSITRYGRRITVWESDYWFAGAGQVHVAYDEG